ncbi:MAG: tetratricopeptide repeat protein [Pseudomonadota bacterium]
MKLLVLVAVSALVSVPQDASDLAALVKKGEGWGTTAVTSSEVLRCWATWTALRDYIARNGRGSFPADYTVANLDRRIADWNRAVIAAYAAYPGERAPDSREALQTVNAEVNGTGLASHAERSGMCKTMPGGRPPAATQVAAAPAPAPVAASSGSESPAVWRARGRAFSKGEGVARNPQQALLWTRKAAEAGNAEAQYDLSTYYYQGINGVREDEGEFIRWTRAAANGGHPAAQYNLGLGYYQGSNGLPKNYAESARWLRLSAEQGDPDGQADYGSSLWYGEGVALNHAEAVRWFRKSAEQGHADGQFRLGNAYRRGLGVAFDVDLARRWLRASAAQGNEEAAGMLRGMDEVDREFARRAPAAVQRQPREPAGQSLWQQYSETMDRQRRENCAAAAQGRNRECIRY